MRVLSWNLYHGRDFPPDKALLTLRSRLLRVTERNDDARAGEPRRCSTSSRAGSAGASGTSRCSRRPLRSGFAQLGTRARASGVRVLTSRNVVPPLQRLLANLNPDLIASWEGGSNQLLVREPGRILEHRSTTLTRRPERRRMVWARVRLPGGETVCFANLHASAGLPLKAAGELLAAARDAVDWSGARAARVRRRHEPAPGARPGAVRRAARALRPR